LKIAKLEIGNFKKILPQKFTKFLKKVTKYKNFGLTAEVYFFI